MSKPIGCDQWTGHMPGGYCDRYVPDSMPSDARGSDASARPGGSAPGMYVDEVTDEVFCPGHAGPLAWSARQVSLYSLALKVAGKVDRPIPVPQLERAA